MRNIAVAIVVALLPAISFAQAAPTDQEIAEAMKICNQPSHWRSADGIGPLANRPKVWGPGFEGCAGIEAEFEKRDIARKSADRAQSDAINSLTGRLNK